LAERDPNLLVRPLVLRAGAWVKTIPASDDVANGSAKIRFIRSWSTAITRRDRPTTYNVNAGHVVVMAGIGFDVPNVGLLDGSA
jgi:hypothetical protein